MPCGFSFSWRRAIGVPLIRSGRERKVGRLVSTYLGAGIVIVALLILSRL